MITKGTRLFKTNWLLARIDAAIKSGYEVDKEKLVAEFCLSFNTARRTALEILGLLEQTGRIVIKKGLIWTPSAWEAEQLLQAASEPNEKTKQKEVKK